MDDTRAAHIEITPHWGTDAILLGKLRTMAAKYGIESPRRILTVLGVERLRDYAGSFDGAVGDIADAGLARLRSISEGLDWAEPAHTEAQVVAWTNVILANGRQVSVTARQGADSSDIVRTVTQLVIALEELINLDIIRR